MMKISSTNIHLIKVKNFSKDVRKGIKAGFEQLGSNLVRTGQNQALNEPKFGRTYRIKNIKGVSKLHRASAPKQSPALLSGNYFSQFKYLLRSWKGMEFGNDSEYSEYLEFGILRKQGESKGKGKGNAKWRLAPRPGVQNSVKSNVRNARVMLETNIGRSLKI